VRRIGIVAKQGEQQATGAAKQLVEWLLEAGLEPTVQVHIADACPGARSLPDEQLAATSDLLIVLGGDGTLLYAARLVGPRGTPIFPVNLGHLGFLCNTDVDQLIPDVEQILDGVYTVSERMMLHGEIWRGDEMLAGPLWALNDAVIHVGSIARTLTLEISIDHAIAVPALRADGLIVSSPTGSTAYNLSAGGPILSPALQAMILAPMLPTSLSQRPLVVAGDCEVEVRFLGGSVNTAMLTLDGQDKHSLETEDRVIVHRAAKPVNLVRTDGWSFYQVLREKMGWAIRPPKGGE